jgi:hypothetical protein
MILGEDGEKMSKSRGNVVNPDTVVNEFGADALRLCVPTPATRWLLFAARCPMRAAPLKPPAPCL